MTVCSQRSSSSSKGDQSDPSASGSKVTMLSNVLPYPPYKPYLAYFMPVAEKWQNSRCLFSLFLVGMHLAIRGWKWSPNSFARGSVHCIAGERTELAG